MCYYIIVILNRISIVLDLIKDDFVEICALATTIIVAIVNYKYLKKQDEKNAKNESIKRKAELQSTVIIRKIEMVLHLDSLHNFMETENFNNVLIKDENIKNGEAYAFNLILYLTNLTYIFPNEVFVKSIDIYNTRINPKEINEQFIFNFKNINKEVKYKSVTITEEKETCINIMCCVNKEDICDLEKYNKESEMLNFIMELKIKNPCNIVKKCEVKGQFKCTEEVDLSDGSHGGQKEKLLFKVEQAELKELEITEE